MKSSLFVLLGVLAVVVSGYSACNSTHPYVLSGTCYLQCPWNPPTVYYSYLPTYSCQAVCPSPYYGFAGNQSCVSVCPSSPNMTYYDYNNSKCVTTCPANYYAASNQSCLASCPNGYWGDATRWICVTTCPSSTYYANVTIPLCVTVCPANYYAYPLDRNCYSGGGCPTSPVRYFSDDTSGLCVSACPTNYYADNSTGRCLVYCSAGYFADQGSGLCVLTCPTGYYRSSVTRTCVRTCPSGYYSDPATLNCSGSCSAGSYGDSLTGTCNKVCTMPNFGDSSVGLCVAICSAGLYADNFTQNCVVATSCYSNTIGDPTTNRCVSPQNCPSSPYMFADLTGKICTTRCTTTWGDTVSRVCMASCPWNPQTYVTWANADTRQCLTQCPTLPLTYADNQTRTCTATCSQPPAVAYATFADPTSRSCVTVCPTGFVADSASLTCVKACSTIPTVQFYFAQNGSCVSSCPTGFYADLAKLACVANCSTSPLYFAYPGNNTCVAVCPSPLLGDLSTGQCVVACPQTTRTYADNSTNLCVASCPFFPTPTFGQTLANGTRACVPTCAVGLFADPVTRACVLTCNISLGYYGELLSPLRTCVTECNTNYFANNATAQCVSQCPSTPALLFGDPVSKSCMPRCPPQLFGNPNNNLCVAATSCPSGSFGDSYSNLCVKLCPANQSTFGESVSHRCLQVCPQTKFADNTTRLCSSACSTGLYKDLSSKTCVKTCPSMPLLYADSSIMSCVPTCNNSYFAYDPTRVCVSICPSTPAYYGDYQTYRCVKACPNQTYIFANNTFRGCVANCPVRVYSALYSVAMYADNSTWTCVTLCPSTANLYNFAHPTIATVRTCVTTCPVVAGIPYFAENTTQSCVTRCPSAIQGTYGDTFTLKCVKACSRQQYRDNVTSRCVYQCSPGYFADNTTWSCPSGCPQGYVAETLNRTCALHCPTGYYADNVTRYCQSLCDTETYLYSDNTTWNCVPNCTAIPDYFADPNTKLCTNACTGGLFADPPSRTCLPAINCSTGLIGDPFSGRCVAICPIEVPAFLDAPNNLCASSCLPGLFADNSTMQCVPDCPATPDYYAFNHSTLNGLCVLFCPLSPGPYYRHTPTRECLLACPAPNYFRDTLTLRCVTECSPYEFAEVIGQICVPSCSANSKYGYAGKCYSVCPAPLNADPTTSLCLETCPFGLYAQNGVCVSNCTTGFADPFLKACVPACSPDYFAYLPTKQCRQNCQPQFKYFPDQTCVPSCPISGNLSTNLYMDLASYSCVNVCLPGWFADNISHTCTQTCSSVLFADSSTGLCVPECPSQPDLYGYNRVCYSPCPARTPALYAENLSRTCMPTCPPGSFADSFVWRCVATCTNVQFSYAGPPPVCLTLCPSPLYSNNATKTCNATCPPGTFGENTTRACIPHCPPGSYADSHLGLCVAECNADIPEFADASTQSCVVKCPSIPSFYGQFVNATGVCVPACSIAGWFTLNTTRLCVQNCPTPFFADPVTSDCAYFCQINQPYFADNHTRTCSPTCPNVTVGAATIPTYADPSTRTCVWKCPASPALYGHNATNLCLKKCPLPTYGDSDTRVCLQTCFFNISVGGLMKYTYAQNSTAFCVRVCPPGSWADNLTFTCVSVCSLGYFADSSTWRCVLMCPSNPISFAYSPNRTCIYTCPVDYFASDVGRVCMYKSCPTAPYFYYRDYQNHQCVLQCTYPLFGEITSQSCVTNCSYGYYVNLGFMTCAACPSACLTCINSANCTNCKVGLYHFQGQCVAACPTFPVYYYMYDLSFICLAACPPPYFGFTLSGKCELTCPSGFFKNATTTSCQACPYGCNSCYLNCTSCISGFVYVAKYGSCSQVCSAGLPYFLSRKCVSACPSGTFLLDDLVTCQKCSSICAECAVLATNCTSCQGAFWYNYNCVTQCPSSYFVDRNNFCQQCSSSPGACAQPPLSYYFYTQQSNYKLYIIVVFNRPVSLTAQQFPTVAHLTSSNGPIKASQYTITQTSSTTYSLKLHNSDSLNQMSITLSFNPGSIFDGSGVGLSTTSVTQPVGAVTSVSAQTAAQAAALSGKTNVLGLILMGVLVLMMIRCSYPQLVLLDLLQYMHLHAYLLLSPMPFLFMQVLATLRNLNFAFLPPLFTDPAPDPTSPYYNFQEDTTFIGNCQPFVFFLAIFGGAYLIIWALSSRVNKCVWMRRKAKAIFKNRMRFSFIHEIFYYTEYYVIFFALYQFTGANSKLDASASNLAAAVIVFLCYMVWLVWLTYLGAKYRTCLDKVPQKYRFLVYQESQFPLEIPLRALFKLIVAFVLISGEVSVQLVLLMVFNIVYLIYTLCYRPSKSKITNFLNAFLSTAFIICQIVLFIYNTTNKSTTNQNLFSLVLLAIMGIMILLVIIWVIYRFVKYIREDIMGIKPVVEEEKPKFSSKYSKADYQKIKLPQSKKSAKKLSNENEEKNVFDKDKEMNISELNFQDEQEQNSDGPQITPEEAIQMFTYHHVPKKTEALAKYQRQLLGVKEIKKKNNQPIVLEIDEDQLINEKRPRASRQSNRFKAERRNRGQLRIQGEESLNELEDVNISDNVISVRRNDKDRSASEKKQASEIEANSNKESEEYIPIQIKGQLQSQQSNYWTRRNKNKVQNKVAEPAENRVFQDLEGQDLSLE